MLKLIKYEFRKTWFTKLVLLALTGVLELVFLYGLYAHNDSALTTGTGLLILTGVCGVIAMGIVSVVTLHRDMNTRQGYMLFMTPHSTYAILGAKVLECTLSLAAAGLFYAALGTLDVGLLSARYGELEKVIQFTQEIISAMGQEFELNSAMAYSLTFYMIAFWLCFICTAYLADVLSSTLLRGKRLSGLVAFIFLILLNSLFDSVYGLVPFTGNAEAYVIQGLIALGLSAVTYIGTAYMMDRFLSV